MEFDSGRVLSCNSKDVSEWVCRDGYFADSLSDLMQRVETGDGRRLGILVRLDGTMLSVLDRQTKTLSSWRYFYPADCLESQAVDGNAFDESRLVTAGGDGWQKWVGYKGYYSDKRDYILTMVDDGDELCTGVFIGADHDGRLVMLGRNRKRIWTTEWKYFYPVRNTMDATPEDAVTDRLVDKLADIAISIFVAAKDEDGGVTVDAVLERIQEKLARGKNG